MLLYNEFMQEILTEEKTQNKILLIDGHNLLFQMFFGMPARIKGKNGNAVQGTLGFTAAVLKMIKTLNPTHVLVVFDGEHHNARCDINQDYKANRPDYNTLSQEENPFSQLNDVYNALDYLKIARFECTTCECDDLIAGYANALGAENQVIICSYDSDFFQLISDNVKIFRYRGDSSTVCDKQYLKQKFDILPCQYADFKSLTGDNADNVKGADKIGQKTASKLINEYFTLENLLQKTSEVKRDCIRKSLIENTNRLKDNYKIIKLDGCTNLPFTLESLTFEKPTVNATQVLKGINLF